MSFARLFMRKFFIFLIALNLAFGVNLNENSANLAENSTNSPINSSKSVQNPPQTSSNQMLLLAKYDESLLENGSLKGYVVSEKLDGVRAFWDGKVLKARSNKAFAAPKCWLEKFPSFALDGELMLENGGFEQLLSVVNKANASCEAWDGVRYHIFDAPNAAGSLLERLNVAQNYIDTLSAPHPLRVIEQRKIDSKAQLTALLKQNSARGGEGLVVRKNAAPYERFRTSNAMKLKAYEDAECRVVAHHEGKGRLAGKFGSLTCEQVFDEALMNPNSANFGLNSSKFGSQSVENSQNSLNSAPKNSSENSTNLSKNSNSQSENSKSQQSLKNSPQKRTIRFKIGSGFDDKERENPPPIGSLITYKFNGYTAKGLPKFPVFLRLYQPQ